jgi:hypothetical protein
MAGHTQDQKKYQFLLDQQEEFQKNLKLELDLARANKDVKEEQKLLQDAIGERQRIINELTKEYGTLTLKQRDALAELIKDQKKATDEIKAQNKQLAIQEKKVANLKAGFQAVGQQIRMMTRYLMDNDKIIKNTILNLGLSGSKADLMRSSFEQSAAHVARMGGSLEDVQKIMEGYADETGKARVLSASMVDDITSIGKGTGLGIEAATKLGAQFEMMGFDARKTVDYVQGIVDTSERMGVNTTKVLKSLNDNFKKIQTMTFIGGSKAMATMAMNSEKMKVNMADALNLAETTRGLEQVIDMTANLQVMGGEFAKLDPFQALYMSRNEPEKWVEEISKMTRGMFTFKKMSDGTFEKFISPADADRLRGVAKSLGLSEEKLFEIGQRRLDLDKMNRDMMSMGLSPREKELIQGAAVFNAKSGKYEVMLAGKMKDVSTLTKDQAKAFATESESLEKRAKNAQTFEDALKATIAEFKSGLLPVLKTINTVLSWLRPIAEWFNEIATKGPAGWAKVAGLMMGAAFVWKGVLSPFLGLIGQNTIGRLSGAISGRGGGKGNLTGRDPKTGRFTKMKGTAGKATRGGSAAGGAGIGAAALGIGAGIGLAAVGIAQLAKAMAQLDSTQIWALPVTVGALALSFWALSPAIIAASTASATGALGMAVLGATVVGIGFGINLATKGIGKMAEGLGTMFEKSKGAGKDMLMIAGGIGAIGLSAALLVRPKTLLGLGAFAGVMLAITAAGLSTALVANNIAKMGTAMSGSKDDWIAVQNAITAIGNANFKGGGMIADLARLMKSPLKVEFANKDVALNTYVTLDVNGQKFLQAVGATAHVIHNSKGAKAGQESIQ